MITKKDLIFISIVVLLFIPFFIFPSIYHDYKLINAQHPFIMAFLKFAILSTLGESLGLRIKMSKYNIPGFGLGPRAIVWGILGVVIAMAMQLFASGAPILLNNLTSISNDMIGYKVIRAFSISVCMNCFFAPLFMTFHKISDMHIMANNGSIKSLIIPINMAESLQKINWKVQWGFVFKKTIPLFWIPAHTITFMLPPDAQVLFAAFLGMALGVILSIAARK